MRRSLATAFLLIVLSGGIGCQTIPKHVEIPWEHIVMADGRGKLLDPTGNTRCADNGGLCDGTLLDPEAPPPSMPYGKVKTNIGGFHALEYEDGELYVDLQIAALKKFIEERERNHDPARVLLFIHGGLNNYASSLQRATVHTGLIKQQTEGTYPIFLNWKASLLSNYVKHLTKKRQGKDRLWNVDGVFMSPVVLGADVARAVFHAPLTWTQSVRNDLHHTNKDFHDSADQLAKQFGGLDLGENLRSNSRKSWGVVKTTLFWPSRILLVPLIDAGGKGSWDAMKHSLHKTFYSEPPDVDELPEQKDIEPPDRGAFALFLDRLDELLEDHTGVTVTIISHSMGAIVANEIIRNYPDFNYEKIVYFAAASSVEDYEDTIYSLLRDKQKDQEYGRDAIVPEVFHYTLQHDAELQDALQPSLLTPFTPRGSLLVWIDSYFGNPDTERGLTSGRTKNLVFSFQSEYRWKLYEDRIHFVEFDYGNKEIRHQQPRHHGDFTQLKYWDESCYPRMGKLPESEEEKKNRSLLTKKQQQEKEAVKERNRCFLTKKQAKRRRVKAFEMQP